MVTRYHFDLYPRTDPRDGSRLVRFTGLQKATYRDVIGVGSGAMVLRSTHADADFIDPLGEQYVRVVEETDAAETVVGGFWLSDTKHETAVQKDTLKLTLSGPATMAYLARAVMAPHTYIHAVFTGQDPFDDIWRLHAQSTVYANGSFLGAMLWRVIYEAQHFRSGATYTHRHKDGLTYTDSHSDDRLATAIPDLVMDFDQYVDSDGNDWTLAAGEFQAQVGENVLSVVQRLIQAGLYVEMDPDTFHLRAWETRPASRGGRSTDRTGSSWASDVVRFQKPTGGDIDTGNIKSDTERQEKSFLRRTVVWAGGGDVYAKATGTSDIPWEGFESANLQDAAALSQLATAQINAREEAASAVSPKIRLGDDPANGYYRPWQEVRLDELVTVHTGTGQWDFEDQTFPVAGLRIEQKIGGDWNAWVELGASYEAGRERRFQVGPPASHSHPPNPELCLIGHGGSDSFTRLYPSLDDTTPVAAASALWDHDPNSASWGNNEMHLSPGSTTAGGFSVSTLGTGGVDVRLAQFSMEMDATLAAILAAGGATLRAQFRTKSRHGIGIDEAAQKNISQITVRVTQGATATIRGTAYAGHSLASEAGSVIWLADAATRNSMFPPAAAANVLSAVAGAVAGDYLVVEVGYRSFSTDDTGGQLYVNDTAASDLPEDETTNTNLRSWIEIGVSGVGAVSGDLPLDTVRQGDESTGTSVRAARCDHQHAHGLLSTSGTHYHDREDIEGELGLTLDELSDVEAAAPTDGQVLTWDDSEGLWVPATVGAGVGRAPYAGPVGWSTEVVAAGNYNLAAGGALAVPIFVAGPMVGQGVALANANTSLLRSCEFRLFVDNGDSTVDFVASTDGTMSFTPVAVSVRRGNFSGVPVTLSGWYWLVVRNTHASNAFDIRRGSGSITQHAAQSGSPGALGSSLELVTGWTTQISVPHMWIEGRALGLTSALV